MKTPSTMKTEKLILLLPVICLGLLATTGSAQTSSVTKARSAPGPDPDLFDGTAGEAESRPENGIISDFEMGSGESNPNASKSGQQQQQQQGQGGQPGSGGGGSQSQQSGQQGQGGGGGGSEEMIEEGEMPEQQGQQGQQGQGGQQGQQGQQSQSSQSSQSSQQSNSNAPQNDVQLGDESLKIETVDLPADENLIGQEESKGKETKDTAGGGASGQQGPRRNTGVEQGDAMPSDI